MLRAALIGFTSSGKTTLFHLMTSGREPARGSGHGKLETSVGISKVPDARLDRLTAMYNPRKRVPATVEFTDLAMTGGSGAKALVDVVAYKKRRRLGACHPRVSRSRRAASLGRHRSRARRAGDGRRADARGTSVSPNGGSNGSRRI
jgi:hypothetical protein